MRRTAAVLFVFSLLCCLTRPALAQEGSATLTGFIQDSSKAVIPGVKVTAIETATNQRFEATTGKDGSYTIVSLPVGPYQLQIEKPGFKTILKDDLFLHTQDALEVNFQMAVGSTSETITVNGSTRNDSPAVSMIVNRDFIENTALNGQSLQDLIALAPGAVSSGGYYSIDGLRTDANNYVVDGIAGNVTGGNPSQYDLGTLTGTAPAQTALGTTQSLASTDTLQEFKIQTSGYAAEYGRQPGAQIELTTRSGTNSIHGTLFDYFRNDALDANSWELDDQVPQIPKQAERQNDFGGTLGGPLSITRLYNGHNRTFYFASYEGLRLDLPGNTGVFDVPTSALRSIVSPAYLPFLQSEPLPNVGGHLNNGDSCAQSLAPNNPAYAFSCTGEFLAGLSTPSSIDSLNLRIDHSLGNRFHAFARYSDTSSGSTQLDGPPELQTQTNGDHSWTGGLTTQLSARVVDELRVGYTTANGGNRVFPSSIGGATPYPVGLVDPAQYVAAAVASTSIGLSIPNADSFEIPNYFGAHSTQQQWNVIDSVQWTRGRHSIKAGIDYRRLSPTYASSVYTGFLDAFSVGSLQQGIADLAAAGATQPAYPIYSNFSYYAQDHWKVRSNLTLDYGLRWEVNPAPGAADGIFPVALTTGNIATAELAPPGTPAYATTFGNIAPRFGFAYSPSHLSNHSTVIRGGFGLFYDTGQATASNGYHGYPFSAYNIAYAYSIPVTGADIAPPSLTGPLVPPYGNLGGVTDPHLALPYAEGWNLTVDENLNSKNVLSMSYVGNNGRRLLFTGTYGSAFSTTPLTINPNFTGLNLTTNASSSTYHGLQLQDQGYLTPALQLISTYTFAHAIDNASSNTYNVNSNLYDAPVRGNAAFDVRQEFNLAVNYQPEGVESSRLLHALTSHWLLNSRLMMASGYPIDVYVTSSTLPNGTDEVIRPDRVPGIPLYEHNVPNILGGWELNPLAFTGLQGDGRTPPGTIPVDANGNPLRPGTLGRNYLHGPAFWNLNSAVQRSFHVFDQLSMKFRIDAFNILNHPNPGEINYVLYSSTFGQSSFQGTIGVPNGLYSSGSPRSLQAMLKLEF